MTAPKHTPVAPRSFDDPLSILRILRAELLYLTRLLRSNPSDSDAAFVEKERFAIGMDYTYARAVGPCGVLPK